MKIWVIGREYPSLLNGMRGSFEIEQARMLSEEYQVYYPAIDLHSVRHWRKWGLVKTKDGNVNVWQYHFPVGKVPEKIFAWLYWYFLGHVLKLMEKEGLPDVIHVHYPAMFNCDLLEIYKKKGIKIVCTEHWSKVMKQELNERERYQLQWFAENADTFLCVGEKLRDSVKKIIENTREIKVIPNTYAPCFEEEEIPEKYPGFSFVSAGRMVKEKQFDLLIKAFVKAFQNNPNVFLRIIGTGREEKNLKELIKKHNMESRIFLMGLKNTQEVAEIFNKSQVIVCPSKLETFGVPVIEGMACGKPYVASEGLGFRTGLSEACGKLVEGTVKGLTEGMTFVYQNYQKYDKNKIKAIADQYFSQKAVMDQLREVYSGKNCMVSASDVEL